MPAILEVFSIADGSDHGCCRFRTDATHLGDPLTNFAVPKDSFNLLVKIFDLLIELEKKGPRSTIPASDPSRSPYDRPTVYLCPFNVQAPRKSRCLLPVGRLHGRNGGLKKQDPRRLASNDKQLGNTLQGSGPSAQRRVIRHRQIQCHHIKHRTQKSLAFTQPQPKYHAQHQRSFDRQILNRAVGHHTFCALGLPSPPALPVLSKGSNCRGGEGPPHTPPSSSL